MKPRVRVYSSEGCSWYMHNKLVLRNEAGYPARNWEILLEFYQVPFVWY